MTTTTRNKAKDERKQDGAKQDERKDQDGRRKQDEDEDRGLSLGGRRVLSASPLIWVLLVGAVIWAGWATITRGSSSSSKSGLRAVLVPTGGGDRMLVALPCSSLGGGSGSFKQPTGATSVVLPAGSGQRVVLVPGCQSGGSSGGAGASSGGSSGGSSSGSSGGSSSGGSGTGAVVVLPPGSPAPKQGKSAPSAAGGSKVTNIYSAPSSARTIVVTPCQGKSGGSGGSSSGSPPAGPRGRRGRV